jgi:hypothetical protein
LKDVETVKVLWTRFPHGLSNSQYQQELARM